MIPFGFPGRMIVGAWNAWSWEVNRHFGVIPWEFANQPTVEWSPREPSAGESAND